MVEIFAKEPSQDDRVTLRIFMHIGQKKPINNAVKLSKVDKKMEKNVRKW